MDSIKDEILSCLSRSDDSHHGNAVFTRVGSYVVVQSSTRQLFKTTFHMDSGLISVSAN